MRLKLYTPNREKSLNITVLSPTKRQLLTAPIAHPGGLGEFQQLLHHGDRSTTIKTKVKRKKMREIFKKAIKIVNGKRAAGCRDDDDVSVAIVGWGALSTGRIQIRLVVFRKNMDD